MKKFIFCFFLLEFRILFGEPYHETIYCHHHDHHQQVSEVYRTASLLKTIFFKSDNSCFFFSFAMTALLIYCRCVIRNQLLRIFEKYKPSFY